MEHDDVKKVILDTFISFAKTHSIKKITLDMIARECGISKKTIYKYFKSKDEIVNGFADIIITIIKREFDKIQLIEENPQQVLLKFFEIVFGVIRTIPSSIILDARSFYPEIENRINLLRKDYNSLFINTIKSGVKQGLFKDINQKFLEGFYTGAADRVFDPTWILENNLSIEDVFSNFKSMLFTGLLKVE